MRKDILLTAKISENPGYALAIARICPDCELEVIALHSSA